MKSPKESNEEYRKIIHIDMDAFYASVEQLDRQELKGKPIAVGGSADRGVVAAASYEARKYKVHSALSSKIAKQRCPDLIFVKPRFKRYKEISNSIMEVFRSYTDLVEPLSLDEAYLDVTYNKKQCKSAIKIAMLIRKDIKEKVGLTASAGVSFNKFLAKTASDINKPDGLSVILPDQAIDFMKEMPIERFHGIGEVTAKKMHALGIKNGKDLMQLEVSFLLEKFGKQGKHFFNIVHANDHREVKANRIRKSIGTEETFAHDLEDKDEMMHQLHAMLEKVSRNMVRLNTKGKTVHVKIKFDDFTQKVRSKTLMEYTDSVDQLWTGISEIMNDSNLIERAVRLLGVSVSKLDTDVERNQVRQLTLDF